MSMTKYAICFLTCLFLQAGFIGQVRSNTVEPQKKCHFSTYSVEEISAEGEGGYPYIRAYIDLTSAGFLKVVSAETQLLPVKSTDSDVRIIFVLNTYSYKTPIKTDNKTVFDLLNDLKITGTAVRTLASPWLKLSLTTDCKLTAIFIWNKRQLIADQAFLAGVRPITKGIVTPVNDPNRYLPTEYQESVIFLGDYNKAVPNGKVADGPSVELDEQQDIVRRFVAHKYPSDLFWFFSLIKSEKTFMDDGTFGSQLVKNERKLADHALEVQAGLVTALANIFVTGNLQYMNFDNILDVGSLVDLKEYKNHEIKRIPQRFYLRNKK